MKKYKKEKYVECNDLSREEAIKLATVPLKQPDDLPVDRIWVSGRRIFPGLYDLKTCTASKDVGFEYNGQQYYIQWWPDREDYCLQKRIEYEEYDDV